MRPASILNSALVRATCRRSLPLNSRLAAFHPQHPVHHLPQQSCNVLTTPYSTSSAKTSQAQQGSDDPIRFDKAFLDRVRARLQHKPDTTTYFRLCKEEPVREAAVMMLLCVVNDVPSVLFTTRATHMRAHQGEASFPGGKRDPEDESCLAAALREVSEEIFIQPSQIDVLGEFSAMPNKGCTLRVHPFVGILKEPLKGEVKDLIRFNEDEVQKVFTVPIQFLMDPTKRQMVRFRNSKYLYPVWKVPEEEMTIWGLTACILDGVLRRISIKGPEDPVRLPEGSTEKEYQPPKPSA